jgi:ubiquitin carboxyl-terminal hydrolase 47
MLQLYFYLQKLHLEGVVPVERCRLVNYDRLQDTIVCSFEGREDDPIGDILNSLRGNYKYDFLLEIRKDGVEFEIYQPGGKFEFQVVHVFDS